MGPPPINMGKRALLRIMGPSRRQVQIDHEEELKASLLNNYQDHVYLK